MEENTLTTSTGITSKSIVLTSVQPFSSKEG